MTQTNRLKHIAIVAGLALVAPSFPASATTVDSYKVAHPMMASVREDGYTVRVLRVNQMKNLITIISVNEKYERHVALNRNNGALISDRLYPLGYSFDPLTAPNGMPGNSSSGGKGASGDLAAGTGTGGSGGIDDGTGNGAGDGTGDGAGGSSSGGIGVAGNASVGSSGASAGVGANVGSKSLGVSVSLGGN
ncbi:hypothetical protein [Celeribacter sp. ULVN23_4]